MRSLRSCVHHLVGGHILAVSDLTRQDGVGRTLTILQWLEREQIDTALIDPGKPWQNGTGESFNGKLRDACRALKWFRSRAEARVLIESWRRHYNETRPHSSLNYLTPLEFKRQHSSDINPAVFQE